MTSLSVCLPSRRREERQKKKILSLRPPPPCLSHDTKNPCTILPQSLSASSPADMLSSPPSPPSCSLASIVTAMLKWGRGARGANYKREHGRETREAGGRGKGRGKKELAAPASFDEDAPRRRDCCRPRHRCRPPPPDVVVVVVLNRHYQSSSLWRRWGNYPRVGIHPSPRDNGRCDDCGLRQVSRALHAQFQPPPP